ncbi:hypothetical protein SDC9_63439 [bioreactor metagenome]|uniref:Uncharacterized protein n=1 Tax=bioreactor metagenome TaxID=1076179 RepID=A0A644XLJ1_9ZZZZ
MATDRHCVSVRLTAEELAKIDRARGKIPRGTWCRKVLLGKPIPVIPEPNRRAYSETARWAAALSQIARDTNLGRIPELAEVRKVLKEFRFALLGTTPEEDESDSHSVVRCESSPSDPSGESK